jgi:hypothetical protein
MNAPAHDTVRSRIETLVALARLLERVERGGIAPAPDQYRTLVERLQAALLSQMPDAAREAVLAASPAASEIWENLHYDVSGLARSPLDRAIAAELVATEAIHKAQRRPA